MSDTERFVNRVRLESSGSTCWHVLSHRISLRSKRQRCFFFFLRLFPEKTRANLFVPRGRYNASASRDHEIIAFFSVLPSPQILLVEIDKLLLWFSVFIKYVRSRVINTDRNIKSPFIYNWNDFLKTWEIRVCGPVKKNPSPVF